MTQSRLEMVSHLLNVDKALIRVQFYQDNADDPVECEIEGVVDLSNELHPSIVIQVRAI